MKIDREHAVCFTGHRYAPQNCMLSALRAIERLVRGGTTVFIAGGALGFDTIAARAVLSEKKNYPMIRLVLALPCPQQDALWNESDKKVRRDIIARADTIVLLAERYTPACMHLRNHYMVDNSSLCIAYFDGSSGGTASTVAYARERGVPILNLCENTSFADQISLDESHL